MLKPFFLSLVLATPTFAEDAMTLTPDWEYVADTVMGGVSTGQVQQQEVSGRMATRLTGDVSLENNGGFVQMAFDVSTPAGAFTGIEITVLGNGEVYELRARTDALSRPWQSFRAEFNAPDRWTTIRIPFTDLAPHKTDATFDPGGLRRLGLVAIGRAFRADLSVSGIQFYR